MSQTYDAAGQLTAMSDVTASGTVINQYTYTYDADGQILAETSSNGQVIQSMT